MSREMYLLMAKDGFDDFMNWLNEDTVEWLNDVL